MNVIWKPQPKQSAFMRRGEYEAMFGGSAGGGKSDAVVIEALRQVHIPHYKGLILRKTYPELSELIEKSLRYYPRAFPGARYNASEHTWTFPSGAKIIFGSMQYTKDRIKYQGKAYDFIAFDELTHFLYDEYAYLYSRNRPNGPGTRVYIRATANPGGIGHSWVKERFITAGKPMTPIIEHVSWRQPDGQEIVKERKRIFVPSNVYDNPALLQNDPDYIAKLAMLPEKEKNALLYGDWDTFAGQAFTEWRNDPDHYRDRINTHVIEPFEVPDSWPRWCSMDWGYAKPFSVNWYAIDPDGRIYMIREYYGCTGTPDKGVEMEPAAVAREIKRIEAQDPNLEGKRIQRVGDPAIWGTQTGESVGLIMERERVYFEKGDNSRLSGKMQVHNRLAFDVKGRPMLQVFDTCRHFIRTFPALVYSETQVEDVDTKQEDHGYDSMRYLCMAHPIGARKNVAPKLVGFDPLAPNERENREYAWYNTY